MAVVLLSRAQDAALADLVCDEGGAVAEACPVASPCRRDHCIFGCCEAPLGNCRVPLSQPCNGSGQNWADRWSVDSAPVTAQQCGGVYVAGGYDNVGRYQVLSGQYPLPKLAGISSLRSGHREVQVSLLLFAIDSWDDESITVVADDIVVWGNTIRNGNNGARNLCGADHWSDAAIWVNFTLRHSADTLRLTISNTLNQAPHDESIAIGQVLVAINAPDAFLPTARGVRAETWVTLEDYDSFPSDIGMPWIHSKGNILLRTATFSDRAEMLDAFQSVVSAQERADEWLILLLRLSTCLLVETAGLYNVRMTGAGTSVLQIDGELVNEDAVVHLNPGYRLVSVDVVARDTLTLEWRRLTEATQAWSSVGVDRLYLDSIEHINGRCPNVDNSSVTSSSQLALLAAPGCSGWSVVAIDTNATSCYAKSGTCEALAGASHFVLHVGSSGSRSKTVDYRLYTNDSVTYCSDIPVNEQNSRWTDTFVVNVDHIDHSVTVMRTDRSGGWGQDLQLACTVNRVSAALLARRDVTIPAADSVWLGLETERHRPLPDVWIDGEAVAGSECPEVGEVQIAEDETVSVSLRHEFARPLVFASAALAAAVSDEPAEEMSACSAATVRVLKVRKVEERWVFDLAMVQPSCAVSLGTKTCRWTVSWLAWTEKRGITGQITSTDGRFVATEAQIRVGLEPMLFATIQQYSDSDPTTDDDRSWLVPRSDGLTVRTAEGNYTSTTENVVSFRLKYQRAEGVDNITSSANIAWLLIPAGEDSFGSCAISFEVGSLELVDHRSVRVVFAEPFLPFGQRDYGLLSHIATSYGRDPASIVRRNTSLFISEEQCSDDERTHTPETIHWMRMWRNPLNLSRGSHVIEVFQPAETCLSALTVFSALNGDCQEYLSLKPGENRGTCGPLLRHGESCRLECSVGWHGEGSIVSCDSGLLSRLDAVATCSAETVDCNGSPLVRIVGPAEITTVMSRPLALRATAELPECATNASQLSLSFEWSVYNASTGKFDTVSKGPSTLLPAYTFAPGHMGRVRVSASVSSESVGTKQSTADLVVFCQRSPLLAVIEGGSSRLVGRSAAFVLDGSASHDPDDLEGLPSDASSWACTEQERREGSEWRKTQAPCPIDPPSGLVWNVASTSLSVGSRYRFVLTISRDQRSASAETLIEVSAGSPPDVLISGGSVKANPTSRLALYGYAESFVGDNIELRWTALVRNASSADYDMFDLTKAGVLSTSVHGANLVVQPHQLDSTKEYTFVLTATGRDSVGYSKVTVAVNAAPCCGTMRVEPADQGVAVLDPFTISALGWHDEDLPLSYLFATALSTEDGVVTPLVDFGPESFATVRLPAGSAADNYRRCILLEVRDVFDATGSSSVDVRVQPFTPTENVSIQDTATALLAPFLTVQDTLAIGQIVLGICEALNDDTADTSNGDAAKARDILLDALIASTAAESTAFLTESTVSRSTAIMLAVTGAPTHLSSIATDKSLTFAKQLSSSSDRLSSGAIESISKTASNLLDASMRQFEHDRRRRLAEDDTSIDDGATAAYSRSSVFTGIVNDCATAIAHRHVVGEEEQVTETRLFELRVTSNTVMGWENAQVGGGRVAVPPGAFAGQENSVEPIVSKIITYNSIGPLFYAPLAPTNDSVRGTGLVSVTFAREGKELHIANLSQAFIVQLPVDPVENGSRNEPLCGHFDTTTQDWVVDGKLEGRTVDHTHIVCSYLHLTDFVAFLGPEIHSNEVSILKIFSAEWLANPAGAIISMAVLGISIVTCAYSMHQYVRMMKYVKDPVHMSHFHKRTDAFAEKRLKADAQHVPLLHRWAVRLQQRYQLGAMCCGDEGDPYPPSQRFMVFMMGLLVSLFINILFFESEEPVCTRQTLCNTTCYGDICRNNSCVETDELVCVEDDLGNGFLASVISALIGLPVVGSLHIAFSWVRKPLEQELARKVLLHEKKAGTLVVRSASGLAAGDWDLGTLTNATSDPYCIVYWNDKRIGRTKVLCKVLEPRWDAAFNLATLVGAIDAEAENVLRVEVWEWDQLSGDDFLGAVHLAGQGTSFLPRVERGYSLESLHDENSSLVQGKLVLQFLDQAPRKSGLVDTRRCGGPDIHYGDGDERHLQNRCCCCCCHRGCCNGHNSEQYQKSRDQVQPASPTTGRAGTRTGMVLGASSTHHSHHSTPLPAAWEIRTSRKNGKLYYYNRESGTSTFELPGATTAKSPPIGQALDAYGSSEDNPLPTGWSERRSRSTGRPYYYHEASNASVWKRPTQAEAQGKRVDDPSEVSELPGTPVKVDARATSSNMRAASTRTMHFAESGQRSGAVKLAPVTHHAPGQPVPKLPELVLKASLQTRVLALPPMTGLTSTLQASRRRLEANAKVAADNATLDMFAAKQNSRDGVTLQRKRTVSSLMKRGAEEQRRVELRRLHHATLAYCYGLTIGVVSSLFIAATAVNFGPEKTLDWLGVTCLSLVWRMFVIEPIKVLWCGAFEGVAGLITGEADDWTEGFADALGDDIEGRLEDAGVVGAGLTAMDNVNRAREKRDAAVKLAAVTAFQAAARKHDDSSPKS